MAPDLTAIVDHAVLGPIAHHAAAERVRGEQAAEWPGPQQALQVVAAGAAAELLEAELHLAEHLHAGGGVPGEVDVAALVERQHTVAGVGAHAEERQEVLGAVAGEQVVGLEADPAVVLAVEAERGADVAAGGADQAEAAAGRRQRALEQPQEWIGEAEVLDVDPVPGARAREVGA